MRAEPIIVVLGPWCGGTSAVAGVLHHLGVFMGADFVWAYRGPHETWEDSLLSKLCVRALTEPGAQLQISADSFKTELRSWADQHQTIALTITPPDDPARAGIVDLDLFTGAISLR